LRAGTLTSEPSQLDKDLQSRNAGYRHMIFRKHRDFWKHTLKRYTIAFKFYEAMLAKQCWYWKDRRFLRMVGRVSTDHGYLESADAIARM
jgi:hypothetical protein